MDESILSVTKRLFSAKWTIFV